MEKLKNSYLTLVIAGILVLLIGGSYALWKWTASAAQETNVAVTVSGVKILYAKGPDITNAVLEPTVTKEEGIVKEIKVSLDKVPEVPVTINFYLDIDTLPELLKHETFKWELYKNDEIVNSNNFSAVIQGSTLNLTTGQYVTTIKDTYKLYIWIDGNEENPDSMGGLPFSFKLRADGQNAIYEEVGATKASCFAFTPATKTITRYYNNEDNNASNPLCPKDVVIPEQINAVDVEVLYDAATSSSGVFYQSNITTLILPNNLKTIGGYAVYSNKLSGTLIIPKNVETIGKLAFYGSSLSNQITNLIFEKNSALTTIGDSAFASNKLSGTLEIPESVTLIGSRSFQGNRLSGTLTIPKNVTIIGSYAFGGSSSGEGKCLYQTITNIIFEENSNLQTIGNSAFGNNRLSGTLTIPKSVITIEDNAFSGNDACNQLEHLLFESGSQLQTIGGSAFSGNILQGTIIIPKTVTLIDSWAFTGTSDSLGRSSKNMIENIIFEEESQLKKIGSAAFNGNNLTSFTIPSGVTEIEQYNVFSGNDNLTNIINKTGLSFQWCGASNYTGIIDYRDCSPTTSFATGTVIYKGKTIYITLE